MGCTRGQERTSTAIAQVHLHGGSRCWALGGVALGLVALLFVGIACLLAAPVMGGEAASPVNPTLGSSQSDLDERAVPRLEGREHPRRQVLGRPHVARDGGAAFRLPRAGTPAIGLSGLSLSIVVEDWSGAGSGPRLLDGTREFFLGNNALCARGTFTSTQAGLARIKMAVGVGTWNWDLTGDERAAFVQKLAVLQHQFLAGWMSMSNPAVTGCPGRRRSQRCRQPPRIRGPELVLGRQRATGRTPTTRASCRRRSPASCRSRASSRAGTASARSPCLTRGRSWPSVSRPTPTPTTRTRRTAGTSTTSRISARSRRRGIRSPRRTRAARRPVRST